VSAREGVEAQQLPGLLERPSAEIGRIAGTDQLLRVLGVLSRLWRATQLRYTWLCSLMGRYEDFWRLTGRSLTFAYVALGLDPADAARGRLAEGYLRLEPYPEVPQALRSLAGRPWPSCPTGPCGCQKVGRGC
jgi:hypothetical protein